MKLLEKDIVSVKPRLVTVSVEYMKFLRKEDYRVSVKFKGRPMVVLAVEINHCIYAVPLTSQTTEKRAEKGKKKRSSITTTFIRNGNNEIANLLYNNMFPVPETEITEINIEETNTFLLNEVRFIRKHWAHINGKAIDVYKKRYDKTGKDFYFLDRICCDYKRLEKRKLDWQ